MNGSLNDDRGSALPLMALSLAFLIAMSMLLAVVVGQTRDRQDAQIAADAAALAGAAGGEEAARSFALKNGATLVSYRSQGLSVLVTVEVDGVEAVAAAKRSVVLDP